MIDDSERREVARRLRDSIPADLHLGRGNKAWGLLYLTLFGRYMPNQASGRTYKQVAELLADLIEPSEPEVKYVAEVKVDGWRIEELVHDTAVELTGIDRDALLRLARYMDKDVAETEAHFSNVISTKSVSDYARRIRKALGVES